MILGLSWNSGWVDLKWKLYVWQIFCEILYLDNSKWEKNHLCGPTEVSGGTLLKKKNQNRNSKYQCVHCTHLNDSQEWSFFHRHYHTTCCLSKDVNREIGLQSVYKIAILNRTYFKHATTPLVIKLWNGCSFYYFTTKRRESKISWEVTLNRMEAVILYTSTPHSSAAIFSKYSLSILKSLHPSSLDRSEAPLLL